MTNQTTSVRGVRGATSCEADEPALIREATAELLGAMLERNEITDFSTIGAIFFTTTPDLTSTFPAEAARQLGMTEVPLICNSEIAVPGRVDRAVRIMLLLNTTKEQSAIRHVYLREAKSLRPDLAD